MPVVVTQIGPKLRGSPDSPPIEMSKKHRLFESGAMLFSSENGSCGEALNYPATCPHVSLVRVEIIFLSLKYEGGVPE